MGTYDVAEMPLFADGEGVLCATRPVTVAKRTNIHDAMLF